MPLQDREAFAYAVITDMRGSAGDKTLHLVGASPAERAGKAAPEQAADPSQRR
jgi:hypothetical protein